VISKAGARCLLGSGLVGGATTGSKGDTGSEGCDSHDERSAARAMTSGQHLAASIRTFAGALPHARSAVKR
jgi:hypothetical protein